MMTSHGELSLEWYTPAWGDQLRDLLACCYKAEAWAPADFDKFLLAGHVIKVLTNGTTLYGGLMYAVEPDRCRVRRVAVWPDHRRAGCGTFMVTRLCGPSGLMRRPLFTTRVKAADATGVAFAASLGFEEGDRDGEYRTFSLRKQTRPPPRLDD